MIAIDRMEIDDAGANIRNLANAITKQLVDENKPVPVREIALAIDIHEIREEMLEGLDGCLVVTEAKAEGLILLNKNQTEARKRYTIAHEIGHYVNPMHRSSSPEGFRCSRNDMLVNHASPGDPHAKMELEANQFAAELLMPDLWVRRFLRSKSGIDIDHIVLMSTHFQVSKEAAARRYIAHQDVPTAIVFSKNGLIRYIRKSDNFPRLSVWSNQPLPPDCLSATSTSAIGQSTDVVEALGHHWLYRSAGISLGEQTFAQKDGYRITLLTAEVDEAEEDTWEPPKFHT